MSAFPDLFMYFYSKQTRFDGPDLARAEQGVCSLPRCAAGFTSHWGRVGGEKAGGEGKEM